jgi:hypothetical protein
MVFGYNLDESVIQEWSARRKLYRRKTWWLWLVTPVALLLPVALMLAMGAAAFIVAMAIFVVGMATIGIVLARHTPLLYCPHCGKRPVSLSGKYHSPLYTWFCVHCKYWLRQPL